MVPSVRTLFSNLGRFFLGFLAACSVFVLTSFDSTGKLHEIAQKGRVGNFCCCCGRARFGT